MPVIVGGCATYQAALRLIRTSTTGVLVGYGGGPPTPARSVLGVTVPMASAVADVAPARRDYLDESSGRYVHVIADGSIGRSSEIAEGGRLRCGRGDGGLAAGAADGRARSRLPLGLRGTRLRPARGERVEFGAVGALEEILFRPLARRGRHDGPGRRPAPRDGHHGLHGGQRVPAPSRSSSADLTTR